MLWALGRMQAGVPQPPSQRGGSAPGLKQAGEIFVIPAQVISLLLQFKVYGGSPISCQPPMDPIPGEQQDNALRAVN